VADATINSARRFYVYKLIEPEVSQGCEMVNDQRRAMNRLIEFHNRRPRHDTEELVLAVAAEMDIPTPRRMRRRSVKNG